MSHDPGSIDAALAAAIGNDSALIAELRGAFVDSAASLIDLLARARCDANWALAARRLKGLAASFGATNMMALADEAARAVPGDPDIMRRLRSQLALFQAG